MTRSIGFGLALIVAAVLLGVVVHLGLTTPLDIALLRRMALVRGLSDDKLIGGAQWVSALGLPGLRTGIMFVLALALLARHSLRGALIYLVTVIGSITGYTALKLLFARARPALTPWLDYPQALSYPSGHAAGSMVVLLLAAMLSARRDLAVAAATASIAIGLTRPMLGVHWPTDVVGGWLWGAGSALVGVGLVQRVSPRR